MVVVGGGAVGRSGCGDGDSDDSGCDCNLCDVVWWLLLKEAVVIMVVVRLSFFGSSVV